MKKQKNPPKLWLLSSNRWYSAISAYCIEMSQGLQSQHVAHQVTLTCHSKALKVALQRNLPLTKTIVSFSVNKYYKLLRIYMMFYPRIAVSFGGPEATFLQFLSLIIPIQHIRFKGDWQKHTHLKNLAPFLSKLSTVGVKHIILPNQKIQQQLNQRKILNTSIIPFGSSQIRKSFIPYAGQSDLLIVGRLDPVKGHAHFFKIFHAFLKLLTRKEIPHPKLQLIGLPANLSAKDLRLATNAAGLRPDKDIEWLQQHVSNLNEYMSLCSVGIICSLDSEHICRVAVEFLRCGTPLFLSGAGGLEECLFENTGVSYQGLDIQKSAELLYRLWQQAILETDEQRQARAQAAQERFNSEQMGRKLLELIERLSLQQEYHKSSPALPPKSK
ncbi:MAG: glycosyltransferase [Zetaproteobacteria bacterium]|nr:glycosyltransferase [Zetaproteobacteria bacterium]